MCCFGCATCGSGSCGVKGKSYCLMYKLLPREASLFPINIAEDRTKSSSPLFCVSSLGPTVGGLRPISPVLLIQPHQTQFQPQIHSSVSRERSVIKDQASLDTGQVLITPGRRKLWREDMEVGRRGLLEVKWVIVTGEIRTAYCS